MASCWWPSDWRSWCGSAIGKASACAEEGAERVAMITKEPLADGTKVRVTFALPPAMPADRINVVGEFSNWESTLSMDRAQPSGNWELTLELPTGRRYRFRYLIDDQHWLNDIFADDHLENPHGSYDSVIDLRESARKPVKQ